MSRIIIKEKWLRQILYCVVYLASPVNVDFSSLSLTFADVGQPIIRVACPSAFSFIGVRVLKIVIIFFSFGFRIQVLIF